jgi:hypothetical protein
MVEGERMSCNAKKGDKRECADGVIRRTCTCCGKTYGYGHHSYNDGSISLCACSIQQLRKEVKEE